MKMWKLNVENFINSHSSKLGFWGSLFGLKGKKIQVEKNWHGETYSMPVFGNGKNIKFLVQSFTPGDGHASEARKLGHISTSAPNLIRCCTCVVM